MSRQDYKHSLKISKGVSWVGIKDFDRRLFDALITLPRGTSYNAYLVRGEAKTALIDTVNPGFDSELKRKVSEVTDFRSIDFLIMNHAEPDHSSAIPVVMSWNPRTKLVTTAAGAGMVRKFYGIPPRRIKIVRDGDAIDLGGKTLRFIAAPMLHWPETMFTYLPEDGILFPCDFFGAHLAEGHFDGQVRDLILQAKKYFGEIMMPFRPQAERALKKIAGLDIRMIAPSHGPIYLEPENIIAPYRHWCSGETKPKAILVYASMWQSTGKMMERLASRLKKAKIETAIYDLTVADIGDISGDLVDARAVVVGSPMVLNGPHPLVQYASYLLKVLKPPAIYGATLGSYGWSGGVTKQLSQSLKSMGLEVVGEVEVKGPASSMENESIDELAKKLVKKIRG